MGNTILNQWSRSNCGVFSTMAILQHMWVNFDIAMFSEQKAPYINKIEKLFVASGLVKEFIPLRTSKVVDMWLKKWEYILTGTNLGNFSTKDVTFDWKSNHWFVICEDLGDKWKIQNSWGEEYWDKWYGYMKKSDFKKLFTPRRIVANKNIWV